MVGFLFRIFSYAHRVKSILKFAIAHMDFMATGDKDWVFLATMTRGTLGGTKLRL